MYIYIYKICYIYIYTIYLLKILLLDFFDRSYAINV